ncbi:MAG: histidine--tRNA ligase [bacterium]|nr:histidine--tRNA ligase [bacterium]
MVMALKKKPVTGMKDIMPNEMEIRDYVLQMIKDTYKTFGFISIETPCMEHIENLCSKQGGDNEKLIFKILKRGEKLKIDQAKEEIDLVDGGLRYDLTVPLARYYSNHANELPSPFKAMQIGNVWRADRPQRGRFRQFVQCDIDILGEPGNLAEIELILATTAMLGKMHFSNFTVNINDRNILKAMAAYSGFREEDYDEVFIILDKMDKIGKEGVAAELAELGGYTAENVDKYLGLFDEISNDIEGIRFCREKLAGFLDEKVADSMEMIISTVEATKEADFRVKFDPTLVRGQSYYTGTIFEVTMDEFGGSVAGGGRYDKMIGKFTGQDTPACGFSIGFERIVMLMLENGYQIPSKKEKKAYLLEKNMHKEGVLKVLEMAKADRAAGKQVLIANMKKNKKFQKDQMIADGYEEIIDCYKDSVLEL